MSVRRDRESKLITIVCDQCGDEELETDTDDFDIALQVMKRAGWRSRKGSFAEWKNLCPCCYEDYTSETFEAVR